MFLDYPDAAVDGLQLTEGDTIMGGLVAYGDESGKHGTARAFCMAGIPARKSVWASVIEGWPKLLATRRNTFHAADCEGRHGDFKGWSRDEVETVQSQLADLINEHRLVCHAISIDYRRYLSMERRFKQWRNKYSPAYFLVH